MKENIIKSKISIPKCKESYIDRYNLFSLLDESKNYNITTITAPAGFGKSTLVSTWANKKTITNKKIAWLMLDESDNNSICFWTYFLYSINEIIPGTVELLPDITTSLSLIEPSSQSMLSMLISIIAEIEDDVYIVIDDCHLISSAEILKNLKFLTKNMPDNLKLIFSGRSMPDLGLSRLRAVGCLLEIGASELKFSVEEINNYFNQNTKIKVTNSSIHELYERTEGWAAGIQIAGLLFNRNRSEESVINSFGSAYYAVNSETFNGLTSGEGSHRYILDYIGEEVFNDLPYDLQEFLIKTAILNQLCGELCDAATGLKNSQDMLEKLDELNLFIIPLDDNRHWYRYHKLFQDFLLIKLKRYAEYDIHLLYSNAAGWYSKENMHFPAIEYYLKGKMFKDALNLLESIDKEALFRGEMHRLNEAAQKLPSELLYTSPILLINMSWYQCMTSNLKQMKKYMAKAKETITNLKDSELKKSCISELWVLHEILASSGESLELSLPRHSEHEEYIRNNPILKTILLLLKGAGSINNGMIDDARECFSKCLNIAKETNNLYLLAISNHNLMFSEMIRGNFKHSEIQCLSLLDFFNARNASDMPLTGMIYGDLADIYYEWNKLDKAAEYSKKAIKLGDSGELGWVSAPSYILLAKISAATNKTEECREFIEHADSLSSRDKIFNIKENIDNEKIKVYLLLGDYASARKFIDNDNYDGIKNFKRQYVNYYINQLRFYIETDRLEPAEQLLNKLYGIIYPSYKSKILVEILILRSLLFYKLGNHNIAIQSMEEAVQESIKESYVRCFIDAGGEVLEILKKLPKGSDSARKFISAVTETSRNFGEIKAPQNAELLSEREVEILKLIHQGRTNVEIASMLYLSVNTIKTHLLNIYGKLDVHNRMEAVVKAIELSLIG